MHISGKKLFLGAILGLLSAYLPAMERKESAPEPKRAQTRQETKRLAAAVAVASTSASGQGDTKAAAAATAQGTKRKLPEGFGDSDSSAKKSKTDELFSAQDIQRLQAYRVCPVGGEDVLSYACDVTGQWVALVSTKKNGSDKLGTLRIFDTKQNLAGQFLQSFKEENAAFSLTFSSDARQLMAYSAHEKIVRIWDIAAGGKPMTADKLEGEQIYSDGKGIVTYCKKMVEGQEKHVLELRGFEGRNKTTLPLEPGEVLTAVNMSADGAYVIMAIAPHTIFVLDRTTGLLVGEHRCIVEGLVAILAVDIVRDGQEERLVALGRVVRPVADENFYSVHPLKKSHDSIDVLIMNLSTGALMFHDTNLRDDHKDKLVTYSYDKKIISYFAQRPTHQRVLSGINIFTSGAASYGFALDTVLADAMMLGKKLPSDVLMAVVEQGSTFVVQRKQQGAFAEVDRYTLSEPVTVLQPLADELFVARGAQSLEFVRPRDVVVAEIAQLPAEQQKMLHALVTKQISSITDADLARYSSCMQRVIMSLGVHVERTLFFSVQVVPSAGAGSGSGSAGSAAS